MRQFAGFGTAEDTNLRFHALLEAGGDGLSTAFDMPTLMGCDSDDLLALGEVGRAGVAIDTLVDMETLFAGIDLGSVTTSMTVNSPAAIILAMYVVLGDKTGVERGRLGGTIQNDILKEYQAQKEYIFPPRPSLRLVTDMVRFCSAELPRWHPISISGYHIREAGSTAAQELAFTLANGFAYVEAARQVGLGTDEFGPRLSFFFNAHIDFFEEIANFELLAASGRAGCATEDVDVIALSMHNGSHLTLAPAVVKALRQVGASAAVVVGGVIPDVDRPRLQDGGVRAVLTPGASNTEVIAAIRSACADRLMSPRGS
jgi:methylmalonyl-CoA mutase N-terminal domain/subunit